MALKRLGWRIQTMGVAGQAHGGEEGEVVSGRGRGREKDGEVVGTVVGGFNHSDAICSTPFFSLTVDIFPGEMRGVCVCDNERIWAQTIMPLSLVDIMYI